MSSSSDRDLFVALQSAAIELRQKTQQSTTRTTPQLDSFSLSSSSSDPLEKLKVNPSWKAFTNSKKIHSVTKVQQGFKILTQSQSSSSSSHPSPLQPPSLFSQSSGSGSPSNFQPSEPRISQEQDHSCSDDDHDERDVQHEIGVFSFFSSCVVIYIT